MHPKSPTCTITVTDGPVSMCTEDRTDDRSDDSITTAFFAAKTALNGTDKIKKIDKSSIKVAMEDGEKPQSFSSTKTWSTARTIFVSQSDHDLWKIYRFMSRIWSCWMRISSLVVDY